MEKEGETMKRHGIAAVGLTVALAIVLGGCGLFTKTGWESNSGIRSELPLREYDPWLIKEHETLDEAYARMAEIVPEFGGIFFDDFGTLNVYLTDLSKAQEAFARLEPLLLDYFGRETEIIPSTHVWKAIQGRYNYTQLTEWYNKVIATIFQDPLVVKTDIDERNNRITVGIKRPNVALNTQDMYRLAQRIKNLGVPLEAVAFEDADLPVLTSTPPMLTGKVRPVVGGIQIVAGESLCTLMLPVIHSAYGAGFITNAHCAKPEATVPNPPLTLHQPAIQSNNENLIRE